MILEELFSTMNAFRKYVPGIESNVSFDELSSSAGSAKKRVVNIISLGVYNRIIKDEKEALESLKSAIANYVAYKQVPFDAIKNRKANIDVYKYEQEALQRNYMENYYNSMDTLIQELNQEKAEDWTSTKYYKLLEELPVQTTEDFDSLYPIDSSYLFFFRCIPLQKEAFDDHIKSYYNRASEKEDIKDALKRALVKWTISIALLRFDILEFPVTIRNLFSESKASRNGKDEESRMLELSSQLRNEASDSLNAIDLLLSEKNIDICTQTSFNESDDKIILLP
ncbi:hypothetical protein [Phocaeicola sartorii]|uniref:hypothetical protein n=1 Tax=Phocaeicola sartorii TaxID=671267 RepID=UPI0035195684